MQDFHFPNWVNKFTIGLLAVGGLVGGYLSICLFAAVHPTTVNVGYKPVQPVPFSHKLHAGTLKLDCRYCHNTVEKAGHAAIPPSATCGNCHGANRVKRNAANEKVALSVIHPESELLEPVRNSLEVTDPVEWIRVHNLPDFVYFNHSAHINQGVSCFSCHGRVDKMEIVTRVEPLSMKWCLDCHRNPEEHLRPTEFVTKLDWNPEGEELQQVFFDVLDVDGDGQLTKEEARLAFAVPGKELSDEEFLAGFNLADGVGEEEAKYEEAKDSVLSMRELSEVVRNVSRRRLGSVLKAQHGIRPSTNCSTCHR